MKHPANQTHIIPGGLVLVLIRRLPLVVCFLLAISAKAQDFLLVGNQLINHLSTINGNASVSTNAMQGLTAPATFNQQGPINVPTFDNQNLSAFQSSAFPMSSALAALPPDRTITEDQTAALNFNVPDGRTFVVDLNGGLNLDNKDITVNGEGDLVLNVQGSLTLAGSASIVGDPTNIFVNYLGTSAIITGPGDSVDGQVLIPEAPVDLAGRWNGMIWGGGRGDSVALDPPADTPPDPAPEPGSIVLIVTSIGVLLLSRRRYSSLKNPI